MRAIWNGKELANSDKTILIEGNHYFPPNSVNMSFLKKSELHTTCPWKGLASYYHIQVDNQVNQDAAWFYPDLKAGATKRVGEDFQNYIAFWRGVEIKE